MITEWVANKKMNNLLNDLSDPSPEDMFKMELGQLKKLFFPPFKQVRDCVLISETPVERLEQSFDKAIEMYIDKTGYEASNTETRINDFFENSISRGFGIQIACMVLEAWGLQLKKMEPQSRFCFIMSCDEDHVEIRFHKIRANESMWMAGALEDYKDEAVGYVMI